VRSFLDWLAIMANIGAPGAMLDMREAQAAAIAEVIPQ
jgi:hypothetical protein